MADSLAPPRTADLVVVGCGIFGLSTAYFAAARGRRVVAFDRGLAGSGSSGRSGAIVRSWYRDETLARGAEQCRREAWERWDDVLRRPSGAPPVFHRRGLVVVEGAGESAAADWTGWGTSVRPLAAEDAARAVPFLRPLAEGEAAWWEESAGHVEASLALLSLREAFAREGGRCLEECEVTALHAEGGSTWRVATPRGSVSAGAVVLAPGPWSRSVGRLAGLDLPVTPTKVQVLVADRRDGLPGDHPCLVDLPTDIYCRPLAGGLTHAGFVSHEDHAPLGSMDAFDEGIRADLAAGLTRRLAQAIPLARRALVVGHRAAAYEMTPDEAFLLGPTGRPGLFVAAGGSGHGFKFGPLVGREVAALCEGEAAPFVSHPRFDPARRFGAGRAMLGD